MSSRMINSINPSVKMLDAYTYEATARSWEDVTFSGGFIQMRLIGVVSTILNVEYSVTNHTLLSDVTEMSRTSSKTSGLLVKFCFHP